MGPPPSRAPAVPARHFGLDWLRVGAFGLLMLYHAAMAFAPGDWVVKLAEVEWLSYPMLFVWPWRLALLFIVAGYASRALLARLGGPGPFAWERTKRLLLPLAFGMAVIVPPQSWVRLRAAGYPGDYLHFLTHDAFRFGRFDGLTLPGWEHLWFLFYLWLFTVALVAACRLAPASLRARAAAMPLYLLSGQRLLWVPLLYLVPVRVAITFTLSENHGLFDDWLTDLIYFPCFLFGFALAGTPALWAAIARVWKPALALALASFALLVAVETLWPGRTTPPHLAMALDRAAIAAMLWAMALVMLRLADTWLKRDHRWRLTLSEAVFPCYLLHQSLIVLAVWWLLPLGLPTAIAFALVVGFTALGCALFYVAARSLGPLRPLAGLSARPAYGRRGRAILKLRTS